MSYHNWYGVENSDCKGNVYNAAEPL